MKYFQAELLVSSQEEIFHVFQFCKGKDKGIIEVEISKYETPISVSIDYLSRREYIPEKVYTGYHIFIKVPSEDLTTVRHNFVRK